MCLHEAWCFLQSFFAACAWRSCPRLRWTLSLNFLQAFWSIFYIFKFFFVDEHFLFRVFLEISKLAQRSEWVLKLSSTYICVLKLTWSCLWTISKLSMNVLQVVFKLSSSGEFFFEFFWVGGDTSWATIAMISLQLQPPTWCGYPCLHEVSMDKRVHNHNSTCQVEQHNHILAIQVQEIKTSSNFHFQESFWNFPSEV